MKLYSYCRCGDMRFIPTKTSKESLMEHDQLLIDIKKFVEQGGVIRILPNSKVPNRPSVRVDYDCGFEYFPFIKDI